MGLKHEVVHSVAPRKLYTMERALIMPLTVFKLSQLLSIIYFSHCQLTTSFFHGAPQGLQPLKKIYIFWNFSIQYSFPVAIFKSTSSIRPNVTPLKETTSAVAKGVITRNFPSPLYSHIPFPPIPSQCFQHLLLSVMLSRHRNLTAHITEQSCNGFDTLNILQEILTM